MGERRAERRGQGTQGDRAGERKRRKKTCNELEKNHEKKEEERKKEQQKEEVERRIEEMGFSIEQIKQSFTEMGDDKREIRVETIPEIIDKIEERNQRNKGITIFIQIDDLTEIMEIEEEDDEEEEENQKKDEDEQKKNEREDGDDEEESPRIGETVVPGELSGPSPEGTVDPHP